MKSGILFTGFVPTGWAPCCETWLKFEVKIANVGDKKNDCLLRRKKMMKAFFQGIFGWGFVPYTRWGAML